MAKPECRTMKIGMMYQKSNEPTKTKKAMKTKKFLSMAALALVGAMMTGCSSDDDILQPENKTNVVTLTATVGFDDGVAATRAVTGTGVKTFGAGDQMAVIYKQEGGTTAKAVGTLTSGAGTKSGTFTFTLTNPDKAQNVTYIYPAAMAGETDVDYTKLNSQSGGTLADLGSKYDLATNSGAWNGDNLPSLTLNNQLAILAVTLKNSTDITSTITDMTISDGTNTYAVSRSAAAGPIYVAIQPTSGATIEVTATDGTNVYGKTLATTKTYAANNGYNVTWNMSKMTMTTITWNSSNISDLSVSGTSQSDKKEGITLSANNDEIRAEWQDYGDERMNGISFSTHKSGGFTFTAPTGKYFTKIEMTLTGPAGWDHASLGTGWAFANDYDDIIMDMICKVTWTGTATNKVDLLKDANDFHGENVKSIVFTVYQ